MDPDRDVMRVAVVGVGGVGGLLGALLARNGDDVTFVATERSASALNAHGLQVNSDRYGSFRISVPAVTRLAGPVDALIVAVKAMQLEAAIERIPKSVVGDSILVPLLNGVDHVATLRGIYGAGVIAGTARVASARTAPGVIEHSSPFMRTELALGAPLTDAHRDRAQHLARRLTAAGVDVELRDDELSMLWGKLNFLCPLALLTTRHGIGAGEARTSHRADLVAVIDEIARVADALGASVSAEETLAFFDSVPATMTSSMQHDAAAGRPIELDAIGCAVLRAGARTGIPTPVTERLVAEIDLRAAQQQGI